MITLFKKLKSFFKDKQDIDETNKTEYEKILDLIDKIEIERFINFNNKNNSTLTLRSLYPRITTYTHKLKEINTYLSKDKIVYNGWCTQDEKIFDVRDFFLDTQNQYIDEKQEVKIFKNLTIVFLSFYYEHSLLVEVGEHNTRVLTHFKRSLINTIEDLSTIVNK